MTAFGRLQHQDTSIPLFANVVYQFDCNLSPQKQDTIDKLLRENGAIPAIPEDEDAMDATHNNAILPNTTHFITRECLASYKPRDPDEMPYYVTTTWVESAVRNGFVHEPKYYSPDPKKYFSGIVVSSYRLPQVDAEQIYGCVEGTGGQFRETLTDDVTHFVCLAPSGDLYEKAMNQDPKPLVVLPHYFDQCFKFGRRLCPDLFQFPNPPILQDPQSPKTTEPEKTEQATSDRARSKLIYPYPTLESVENITIDTPFLVGKNYYFSSEINAPKELLDALKERLCKAGAQVSDAMVEGVNTVICRTRTSNDALEAQSNGLTVGTLWWVSNTLHRRQYDSPMRSLLDYPVPPGGIPGMENMVITISTYSDTVRDYLRRLILAVGATFTPHMTERGTTHLICASKNSRKYVVAKQWNITTVNHLWIEECMQQWLCKSVADERYIYFPGGGILQDIVGRTPILPEEAERWQKEPEGRPEVVPYETIIRQRKLQSSMSESRSGQVFTDEKPEDKSSPPLRPSRNHGLGAVTMRPTRQAAVEATNTLHNVVVPDMNKYQKESKSTKSSRASPGRDLEDKSTEGVRPAEKAIHIDDDLDSKDTEQVSTKETTSPKDPEPAEETVQTQDTDRTEGPDHAEGTTDADHPDHDVVMAEASEQSQPENSSKEAKLTGNRKRKVKTLKDEDESSQRPRKRTEKAKPEPELPKVSDRPLAAAKIATSGITLSNDEKSALRKMGAHMTEQINQATHLVVEGRILRTPKFLCAINLGLHIVSMDWIKETIEKGESQDESLYAVKDDEMENRYKFSLSASIESARKHQVTEKKTSHGNWLSGYDVYIQQSSKNALKEVIETAGGEVIPKPNARKLRETVAADKTDKLLVLSTEEGKGKWGDFHKNNISVYDPDLVIVGTFRQRLDLDEFRISS